MSEQQDDRVDPRLARRGRKTRSLASRLRSARRLLTPPSSDAERTAPLEAFFGPLELRVLESLWEDSAEATVRDVQRGFPDSAYTTLMTTLDRLYKKGALDRRKRGRAFLYSARCTRAGLEAYLAQDAFEALLDGGNRMALKPLLSSFVEAVSQRDSELLDDLEELVRDKRQAQRDDPVRASNRSSGEKESV